MSTVFFFSRMQSFDGFLCFVLFLEFRFGFGFEKIFRLNLIYLCIFFSQLYHLFGGELGENKIVLSFFLILSEACHFYVVMAFLL